MPGPKMQKSVPVTGIGLGRAVAIDVGTQAFQFGDDDPRKTNPAAAPVSQQIVQHLANQQGILPTPGNAVGHTRVHGTKFLRPTSGG